MMTELWREVARTLKPVTARANAAEHRLELLTGGVVDMWSLDSPDVARGRKYARVVIDEAAMVPRLREAWDQVIRSTLADYAGDAWFLSTPKGYNDYHILYQFGQSEQYPEWASWQMPTATNPHISRSELESLERDLPSRVYRQEILALFEAENEGALWSRQWIDDHRMQGTGGRGQGAEQLGLTRVVVAVDPSGSRRGDEVGLVVAGKDGRQPAHAYVLADASGHLGPDDWARRAISLYEQYSADCIVAEANFGGEMVQSTIAAMAREMGVRPKVQLVHASRGKVVRAEPCAVLSMQGLVHHVGLFPDLENELCLAADTLILTKRGQVPIQSVTSDDFAWTRSGWRRILWAGQTADYATLYEITTEDQRTLRATAGHPVYTVDRGFIPVAQLNAGYTVEVALWANADHNLSTTDIVTASTLTGTTAAAEGACCTAWSGKKRTDPYPTALRSTTRTATRPTMTLPTSWPCPSQSTASTISTVLRPGRQNGAASIAAPYGSARHHVRSSVDGVARLSGPRRPTSAFAPGSATRRLSGSVRRLREQQPVFNLTVEGAHEYYANAILVHNCSWSPQAGYSPGRLDALVWCLSDLVLQFGPAGNRTAVGPPRPAVAAYQPR
jgi:phage terminase large subunit-like protein